jgi:hypothetical protein
MPRVFGPLPAAVRWTRRRLPARRRTRCATRGDGVQPSGYLINLQHGMVDPDFQNLVAHSGQQLPAGGVQRLRAGIPGSAREGLVHTPASSDGGRCHARPFRASSGDTSCTAPPLGAGADAHRAGVPPVATNPSDPWSVARVRRAAGERVTAVVGNRPIPAADPGQDVPPPRSPKRIEDQRYGLTVRASRLRSFA